MMNIIKRLLLASAFIATSATFCTSYVAQCDQETVERVSTRANQLALETYESMLNTRSLMTPKDFIRQAYKSIKYSSLRPVRNALKAKMDALKSIKKDLKKLRSTSEQAETDYQIAKQNYKTAKANYEVFKSGPYQNLKKEWLGKVKATFQQQ